MCKRCSTCGLEKPRSEFRKRRDTADGLQYTCTACSDKLRRESHLRQKYGMKQDDYDTMFHAQDGKCAICREPPATGTVLRIDHDHGTKDVRQLLCNHCNVGLGMFKDSRQLLLAAVEYLDGHIHW